MLLPQQAACFLVFELIVEVVDVELGRGPQRFGCERAAFLEDRGQVRVLDVFAHEHETSDFCDVSERPPPLRRLGSATPSDAAREARMRSNSTEAGSSFGFCGTSSPRKALASNAGVRRSTWARAAA